MPRGGHRPEELQTLERPYEKYFGERPGDKPGRKPVVESMPRRRWQVQRIKDIHHEIMRRLLIGQKKSHIARQVGCTAATVSNVESSPIIQEQLSVMRAKRDKDTLDVAAHIQRIAPKSIKLLEEIITGTGAGRDATIALRAKCAESNLDRAGHGAVKKFQGAVGHFTSDDIKQLKEEALSRRGPVVSETSAA